MPRSARRDGARLLRVAGEVLWTDTGLALYALADETEPMTVPSDVSSKVTTGGVTTRGVTTITITTLRTAS